MSIDSECSLIQHIAGDLVSEGWTLWRDTALSAVADTNAFLQDLQDVNLTPISTAIEFDIPVDLGVPFDKPLVPAEPDLIFQNVVPPNDVNIPDLSLIDFEAAPDFDAVPPALSIIPVPGDLEAEAPVGPPDSVAIVLPDVPVIVLPDVPLLEDITLPLVPTTTIPVFAGVEPTLDIDVPPNTFDFVYEDYVAQLPTLVTTINTLLGGGTGLPPAIWDALWERARDREQVTGDKLIQEVTDDWASRGFSLPGGVLDKKIVAARQEVQNASNTLSRDIAIKEAEMEVENVRFAVAQGIAYETMYISLHNQKMQLTFESARYAMEVVVQLFNSEIAYQNIQLQTYLANVQVYKTLIEAEMLEIEVYKAQLEGQKLVGDINQQYVVLYNSTIQGLLAEVEIYKGELEGVNALVNVNRSEIEAFTAQVEAFTAEVDAKDSEVKMYAARIGAEESKVNLYNSEVNAFAGLVGAYKTENDSLIAQEQLKLQNNEFTLEKFKAQIQKYSAYIDAEAKRVTSGVGVYDGQARMYTAELGAEQSRVVADSRQFDLALQEGKTETSVELSEAQLNIDQLLRTMSLEIEKAKTLSQVQSQLAASAMSAVNLSAAVSEAAQNSSSCSTNTSTEI